MLFRPTADQNLDAIRAMLDVWNVEADRFRRAAIAARRGETPTSLTVMGAAEAHDELNSILGEIDAALDKANPGSPLFADLLRTQMTASALLESVGTSLTILDSVAPESLAGPTHIAHELRIAAE